MPIPLAGMLAMSGVSALAGLFGNRSKKVETSNVPVYTQDQQNIQHWLGVDLQSKFENPQDVTAALRAPAADRINRTYAGLDQRLQRSASGRGFGRSGKLMLDRQGLEIARAGEIGDLESKFAGMQLDYENQLRDQAMRFAFSGAGSQGTQTMPGNMVGGALSSGVETATTLFGLNELLKRG